MVAFMSDCACAVSSFVSSCGLWGISMLGDFLDFSASLPLCLAFLDLGMVASSSRLRFPPGDTLCRAIFTVTKNLRERIDHSQAASKDEKVPSTEKISSGKITLQANQLSHASPKFVVLAIFSRDKASILQSVFKCELLADFCLGLI